MATLGLPEIAIVLLVVLFLLVAVAVPILVCAILYGAFRRVPPQQRLLDPGLVWLLVIPCVPIVWNFFVYPRLSRSLKAAYDAAGRKDVGDCGEAIGIAYSVCAAMSAVPYLGCLTGIPALVLVVVYLVRAHRLAREIPPADAAAPPPAGTPPPAAARTSPALIALLVALGGLGAVAMLGIIGAIAIPNLLNAIDRGKQVRTMTEMRSIATAIEAYRVDRGIDPTARDLDELAAALQPSYIAILPTLDGWQHRLVYHPGEIPGQGYTLTSLGKDGAPGPEPSSPQTTRFEEDLVLVNGRIVQGPHGAEAR